MNILTPITITAAMISAGTTVAEPAAGETAWVSGGTYALGALCIRATTHRVYECVQAHTMRTALPEVDSAYWLDKAPTQRWAPFDWYISTAATATSTMTYVLRPGAFFNAISLYGLVGVSITVTVKDAPGGTSIYTYTGLLSEPPLGWYEYLFAPLRPITKLVLTNIPIRPDAELTITLPSTGAAVGIGMINVGDYRPLMGGGEWGGTEYGASAEPISYSYVKTNEDGTTKIQRRTKATGMSATVVMAQESADYALACIQEVLDVPVTWIATDAPGYAGLNVFGLGSARASYDAVGYAKVTLTVKGFI